VDVIISDYMSEANMVVTAVRKVDSALPKPPDANPLTAAGPAFEATFLEALEPALNDLAKYKIRVAVNAGASDTEGLYKVVLDMIGKKGLASQLKVAWISGDEVLPAIMSGLKAGSSTFKNIYTGENLDSWSFEPIYAQAYLGGLGIAAALSAGADIVICGRVSDASPVIGAAYWWHGWQRDELDKLANAFVAGHLIECSNYICGGNFSGFKMLEDSPGGWVDIGYPIAEISPSGAVIITKQKSSGGALTVDTCTSQLLYEIQGPCYLNSDVTAVLPEIWFEQLSTNRVALHGVKSLPPPPTTKVGITARGGFQAEVHWFLTGLDIPEKARMLEAQLRHILAPYSDNFSLLSFSTLGTAEPDADSQNAATVVFRVFAQTRKVENLMPQKFLRPVIDNIMQGYPGATFHLDFRLGLPKPYYEYYVTLLPQSEIKHVAHLPITDPTTTQNTEIEIPPPTNTQTPPPHNGTQTNQPETSNPIPLPAPSDCALLPLGTLIHARSGDKGPDCNVGLWTPHAHVYPWLRTFLSTPTLTKLLGREYNPEKVKIERFELPNARAVHFLCRNLLDRGVGATSSVDFLGKNVAEFIRARVVPIPREFLVEGKASL
jgi:hypothetical protein